MMKIFVTGSSGFIGKELVNHLSLGYDVVEFDLEKGFDILQYDQVLEAIQGCEVVIHLAAIPKPQEDKTFEDYFRINCQGTLNVAKAAQESGVKRLIYASSTTCYGAEKGIPFVRPIQEDNLIVTQHVKVDELECRDCDLAYSTSKVIAEQILANYGMRKKFEVVILRFGPTRSFGEKMPFLGLNLKLENALQAVEKALTLKEKMWYEAFTITDDLEDVDISKARDVLGYEPI